MWSHDYYTSFFSFASYWSYATGIVINLQKTNKKFICEFPVIFLKVMVHSDLGSVQKLRPHLVDTTHTHTHTHTHTKKKVNKTYKLIYVNIKKVQKPKMLLWDKRGLCFYCFLELYYKLWYVTFWILN